MQEFWVFGYGSLMWRPGFPFVESAPALVRGYRRSLCVYSFVHRGTKERPGLVLGLDRGGSCHGLAFRVAPETWDETVSYLRAREQVTSVYVEKTLGVTLLDSGRRLTALTYTVDRLHPQYAGRLDHDGLLQHVIQGHGVSGHCTDYVANTTAHLESMGLRDPTLERLVSDPKFQAARRSR
jgi:glutathione-specific gamma-glutamylcyclotransferase